MLTTHEWETLFQEVSLLGLAGITYIGVRKLMKQPGCSMPKPLLAMWSGCALQLKEENARLSARGDRVLRHFRDAGYQAVILKGQSHLANYPEELRDLRAPGDIDVWVRGEKKKSVYDFVRKDFPDAEFGYLHIHFPVYSETEVEVHIRPAYLCNPFRNYRLQRWADSIDLNSLKDLDSFRDFNAIFQPLHLFKHLSREGINIRQLLDYYFLQKQCPNEDKETLRLLGIDRFTEDLQLVVDYLFEDKPICSETGKILLNEIMINIANANLKADGELVRLKRVVKIYPGEVLWRPYFWLFQKIWIFVNRFL